MSEQYADTTEHNKRIYQTLSDTFALVCNAFTAMQQPGGNMHMSYHADLNDNAKAMASTANAMMSFRKFSEKSSSANDLKEMRVLLHDAFEAVETSMNNGGNISQTAETMGLVATAIKSVNNEYEAVKPKVSTTMRYRGFDF